MRLSENLKSLRKLIRFIKGNKLLQFFKNLTELSLVKMIMFFLQISYCILIKDFPYVKMMINLYTYVVTLIHLHINLMVIILFIIAISAHGDVLF